jgi:16S rRNA (guanine527-N7)-methyltransferase
MQAHREAFDICTARAVAGLNVLVEYCLPLVAVGGYFIAMKGSQVRDEVEAARVAINKLGGELAEVKQIVLPCFSHSLVMIKKLRQTPPAFPRRPDKIAKSPVE